MDIKQFFLSKIYRIGGGLEDSGEKIIESMIKVCLQLFKISRSILRNKIYIVSAGIIERLR